MGGLSFKMPHSKKITTDDICFDLSDDSDSEEGICDDDSDDCETSTNISKSTISITSENIPSKSNEIVQALSISNSSSNTTSTSSKKSSTEKPTKAIITMTRDQFMMLIT